ncbi:sigma-54-dependent transcriptional regulator [Candidatus Methylobacter oryzae]|uniref:Sigma-54-dependent Fis family transcriptional regulator n=1 Tax=Candidatus Methylobacter oryzae TaxID=2497749 RepID=A0ABY3CH71_9GAMM|nr:sigma-54 dependent transcriptional regulator [Candidatus Methylobacter oryzae]TRX03260.1 sigma-54-dependent Fis family transcriptional regulator [Candidatus Methylobacter oryzae]
MLNGSRVLVADDEPNARRVLEILLRKLGCEVFSAPDGQSALDLLHQGPMDLLITDLNMPGMSGLELLTAIRDNGHTFPIIVVTAYGTVENAVAAMKLGAFDFIIRPLDVEQVEMVIRRALDVRRVHQENEFLRDEMNKGWGEFIGQCPAMQKTYELIRQAGPSKASIFIIGETGTGKELVARAIHSNSGRSGLFVPINCAAIPAEILESELFGYVRGAFTGAHKDRVGKFELAHQGTLFLDEITEMPLALQAKLLRVLQESRIDRLGSNHSIEIDIRIIAATNRDPLGAVREQRLREDLYYRINVLGIQLPPLRERQEDIPLLARHFIKQYRKALGGGDFNLPDEVARALMAYAWPGNVRELENMMERAVVLSQGGGIGLSHLPQEILLKEPPVSLALVDEAEEDLDLEAGVEKLEKRLLNKALAQSAGNKAKAARLLKISERTLWYKLNKYGLKAGSPE